MTAEEELIQLRQDNRLLREQASMHQETMSLQFSPTPDEVIEQRVAACAIWALRQFW